MCCFYFIAAFQKQKDHIHLETCCITGFIFLSFVNTVVGHSDFSVTILSIVEMNNVVDKGIHKPIVYGIGEWQMCGKETSNKHACHMLLVITLSLCRCKC